LNAIKTGEKTSLPAIHEQFIMSHASGGLYVPSEQVPSRPAKQKCGLEQATHGVLFRPLNPN
jgi:hypothetical protein